MTLAKQNNSGNNCAAAFYIKKLGI